MQSIFISAASIDRPQFFTRYYTANGDKFMRIENALDCSMFNDRPEVVRIELYNNCVAKMQLPIFIKAINRDQCPVNL